MATLKKIQEKIALQQAKNRVAKAIQMDKDEIRAAKEKLKDLRFERIRTRIQKSDKKIRKARTLSKRFGKSLLKTGSRIGKKVGPAIIKQGKLIRDQQLRDDARERALIKRRPSPKKKSKRKTQRREIDDPFSMF